LNWLPRSEPTWPKPFNLDTSLLQPIRTHRITQHRRKHRAAPVQARKSHPPNPLGEDTGFGWVYNGLLRRGGAVYLDVFMLMPFPPATSTQYNNSSSVIAASAAWPARRLVDSSPFATVIDPLSFSKLFCNSRRCMPVAPPESTRVDSNSIPQSSSS
jgi:hypothetical protein